MVSRHGHHRDMNYFAERLVTIIQPQLRTYLRRAWLEADLSCASVDFRKG